MNKEFIIQTDVYVFSVPDGQKTLLTKGMSGIISQSLGDNYTIIVEGNMYQVKGIDGEAIGEEKRSINSNNFANEEEIWNVLHTCYDPEIPVNIVDLGLVYNTDIQEVSVPGAVPPDERKNMAKIYQEDIHYNQGHGSSSNRCSC